jgi:hypothetical protein
MVVKRQQETFAPVTLGHIRSHGCRGLLVYCISGRCHHSATLNGATGCQTIRPCVLFAPGWSAHAAG